MSPPTPIVEGPRWYRQQIRARGPWVALIPPVLIGTAAAVMLASIESRFTGFIGLIAALTSAPTLLVAGAPYGSSAAYPIAVAAAVPFWLVIGIIVSRRATRSPMATWSSYWREYAWVGAGVAGGALIALLISMVLLGESPW